MEKPGSLNLGGVSPRSPDRWDILPKISTSLVKHNSAFLDRSAMSFTRISNSALAMMSACRSYVWSVSELVWMSDTGAFDYDVARLSCH